LGPRTSFIVKIDVQQNSRWYTICYMDILFSAISWPLAHIFAPNLIQRLKRGPGVSFVVKVYFRPNASWRLLPFHYQLNWHKTVII